jgi:hypothetical protein
MQILIEHKPFLSLKLCGLCAFHNSAQIFAFSESHSKQLMQHKTCLIRVSVKTQLQDKIFSAPLKKTSPTMTVLFSEDCQQTLTFNTYLVY